MMRILRPTQAINSVLDLNLPQLLAEGKRVLIFDLDHTLCRRGAKTLDPKVGRYLSDVQAAGFQVGILTNRKRSADAPIVQALGKFVPVVSAAGKPKRRGFIQLLKLMNAHPEDAVMIGDKRWTDIWGANRMGIDSIHVRTYPTIP